MLLRPPDADLIDVALLGKGWTVCSNRKQIGVQYILIPVAKKYGLCVHT